MKCTMQRNFVVTNTFIVVITITPQQVYPAIQWLQRIPAIRNDRMAIASGEENIGPGEEDTIEGVERGMGSAEEDDTEGTYNNNENKAEDEAQLNFNRTN